MPNSIRSYLYELADMNDIDLTDDDKLINICMHNRKELSSEK